MVVLLTGPSAAGKTTVARLLAQQFGRGVHLEGDLFRRAIVAGRSADAYDAAGFAVVHDDVVAGPLLLEQARAQTFVLLPTVEELGRRAAARSTPYGAFTPEHLHRLFAEETPQVGTWLVTTAQTPEETVAAILAQLPSGA